MARSMGPHSHTRLLPTEYHPSTAPALSNPAPRAQNQGLRFPGNDSGTTGDQAGAKLQCPSRTRDGLHPGRLSRHISISRWCWRGGVRERGQGGRPGGEGDPSSNGGANQRRRLPVPQSKRHSADACDTGLTNHPGTGRNAQRRTKTMITSLVFVHLTH